MNAQDLELGQWLEALIDATDEVAMITFGCECAPADPSLEDTDIDLTGASVRLEAGDGLVWLGIEASSSGCASLTLGFLGMPPDGEAPDALLVADVIKEIANVLAGSVKGRMIAVLPDAIRIGIPTGLSEQAPDVRGARASARVLIGHVPTRVFAVLDRRTP